MGEELLYFNGINGATGDYELPPMTAQAISSIALGEEIDEEWQRVLKNRHDNIQPHLSVNADTRNLAETGWGVIFAAKDKQAPAIRQALKPLLDVRRKQATQADERYYREFMGPEGYRPGDSHLDFLSREPRNMGPGPADPEKVPYYLLIVGSPKAIPYRFQYQLDVQYAVGRIHFDTLEEYALYAQSVVEAEAGDKMRLPRRAVFFGVKSNHDRATTLSAAELVDPLTAEIAGKQPTWELQTLLAEEATKARLSKFLGGEETPAFLFSASHGMGFPNGDPRQLRHQGALLCSDWPGPRDWRGAIPEDFYFSADDLEANAHLAGMLAFFFACYGAGTPQLDEFAHKALHERQEIAPYPFVARLPRSLLGHPKGGALAVVGHVERAWGYSFMWGQAGRQLKVFEDTLDQLMAGYPVGAAIEWFNERHAELSVVLTNEIEEINEYGARRDDAKLAGMWTANKDARSYVIVGDPAVRLPVVEEGEAPLDRPTVTLAADVRDALAKLEATEDSSELAPPMAPGDRPEPALSPADVDFAFRDQFNDLTGSIKKFTDQLATAIGKAATDIMTLEVKTYTTGDLSAVAESGESSQARLRALTHVDFDGDMRIYVPEKREGGVEQDLWKIHMEMVKEAQANRAQFLQAMAEMATNLLRSLRP